MTKRSLIPSLLPYLQGGPGSVSLRLSPNPTVSVSEQDQAPFPFLQVDRSDPLARVVDASMLSNTGSTIRHFFLSMQRDAYRFSEHLLWPRTNADIDRQWQRTFSQECARADAEGFISFSEQIGSDGQLMPFRSLFFCVSKGVWFHPPCPVCGADLEACHDDALLKAAGLKPYSTSLARYLFCPICQDLSGETDFYTFSRQDDEPAVVKDRWALIGEFGDLSPDKAAEFPCPGCDHHQECYGAKGGVASRMSPAFFYPFYMFVYEGMSLKATDFLALVSGASFRQLEQRHSQTGNVCLERLRQRCDDRVPVLGVERRRRFLEVLFLKLSFLGELVAGLSKQFDELEWPDLGPALDGFWVKLGEASPRLPFLWNFNLRSIGIGGKGNEREGLPQTPPAFGWHFMGLCWFYALLVNGRQGMSQVLEALGRGMAESTDQVSGKLPLDDPVFSPIQVFWDVEADEDSEWEIGKDEMALWRDSLELGRGFLVSALHSGAWSESGFWNEWEALTERIRAALFGGPGVSTPARATEVNAAETVTRRGDGEEGDAAAYEMVSRVISKWRDEIRRKDEEQTIDGTGVQSKEENGLEETVVLSTQNETQADSPTDSAWEDDDASQETVILSAGSFGEIPTGSRDGESSELEQTVVLTAQQPTGPVEGSKRESGGEEGGLTETVVISPSARQEARRGSETPAHPPSSPGTSYADGKEEKNGTGGDAGADGGDDLAETVILKPKP